MSRIVSAVCAGCLVVGGPGAAAAQPQAPPPTFRGGVDLVVVEATVVDRKGAVVKDLTPADFKVEIGGKSREVEAADLVGSEGTAGVGPAWAAPDVTTNSDGEGSHTILIIADQTSLGPDSHDVVDAARRWLAALRPTDRVGLVGLPPPGPRVEFTTDHARVAEALGHVSLAGGIPRAPFTLKNIGVWEALRISEDDITTRNLVIERECAPSDLICASEIDATARDIANDAFLQVQPLLGSLRNMLHAMRVLPGLKHAVLLSAGWPIDPSDAGSQLEPVAAMASSANVMLHAFIAERSGREAFIRRISPSVGQDRNMLVSSVEALAGWTGGRSERVTGSADAAFRELSGVLAGYYRLGVRPAREDLDGKPHRIKVKVTRSGASIRSHRRVMVASAQPVAPDAAEPEDALRAAIQSATVQTGLALRATSYLLHEEESEPNHLRVVVAGDLTGGAPGAGLVRVALYDEDGMMVGGVDKDVEIADGGSSRVSAVLGVPPGVYALRIAARDRTGRMGTLHRDVDVRWRTVGDVETTGLTLFHVGAGTEGAVLPVIDAVRRDERLVAQLTFSAPAAGAAAPAPIMEITPEGASAPLVRHTVRVGDLVPGSRWLAQEAIAVGLLPAGRYTVAVTVAEGVPPLKRKLEVLPGSGLPTESAAAGSALSATAAAAPTAPALLALAKPAPFERASMLDPSRVAPALAQLGDRLGDAEARDALDRLKAGPWPTDASKGPFASAPVAGHFVAGLGHLQKGDLEGAATDFRNALRAAPDFVPAMVYLAACYAAGGKDREAASAWQLALVRDRESPWLQRLAIEAWLRADQPAAALGLAAKARQQFPDDEAFVRLQARAQLAAGRTREGLETVESIGAPDETLLLMALASLYTAVRQGSPVWDQERDRAAMKRWRDAYAGTNGASLTLVDAWLADMTAPGQPTPP